MKDFNYLVWGIKRASITLREGSHISWLQKCNEEKGVKIFPIFHDVIFDISMIELELKFQNVKGIELGRHVTLKYLSKEKNGLRIVRRKAKQFAQNSFPTN